MCVCGMMGWKMKEVATAYNSRCINTFDITHDLAKTKGRRISSLEASRQRAVDK